MRVARRGGLRKVNKEGRVEESGNVIGIDGAPILRRSVISVAHVTNAFGQRSGLEERLAVNNTVNICAKSVLQSVNN